MSETTRIPETTEATETHAPTSGAVDLDLAFVRSHFPAFREQDLQGWAFFENAGGSYPCRQVIGRLSDFYLRTKVQPYYAFPASVAGGERMDESYRLLSAWLNVAEDELVLGPSTTQNVYVLARAFRELWQDGDEIVVSQQDHEANAGFWRRLEQSGIVVREWQIDPDSGRLHVEQLDELICPRTRLIAFPHCSNIVGEINPVEQVVARAQAVGAKVVVDGVSYAPHGLPDVDALGADIYMFSLYKTWGPHLGAMVVRRELLEELPNQSHWFNADDPHKKLVPAGPDHAQVAAAGGIVEYLREVDRHHFADDHDQLDDAARGRRVAALFQRHEQCLLAPLLDWLADRSDLRLLGPGREALDHRAPTVALQLLRHDLRNVETGLTDLRLAVGAGDFYGVRPLEAMAVPRDPGVLRLSFVHYTTPAEVEQLIAGLEATLT